MGREASGHGDDRAGGILRRAGLRRTSGRRALVQLLLESDAPLTGEEISGVLAGVMHWASVYRSLDALVRAGAVHRVETGQRVWRFAVCGCHARGHCHAHFVCRQCGRAECLRWLPMPGVPAVGDRYVVEGQEHYVRGLCPGCAKDQG